MKLKSIYFDSKETKDEFGLKSSPNFEKFVEFDWLVESEHNWNVTNEFNITDAM